jgi:acetyltransferase
MKKLSEIFQYGQPANPLDVTGQAISNQEYFLKILSIFVEDENLDIILIGMTAMPFPQRAAEDLVNVAKVCQKPFIVFWTFDKVGENAYARLREADVPLFHSSEACLKGINHLIEYSRFRRKLEERPLTTHYHADKARRSQALRFLVERTGILTEYESKELLDIYGIQTTIERLTGSVDEALEAAEEIGYPVVLKVMSPSILHKTDVGALRVDVGQATELRAVYKEIMDAASKVVSKAEIRGVLVQEMVRGKVDVFAGLINDTVFGPGVLFGLGGTLVELFNDKIVCIPPFSAEEALAMITETRGSKILQGFRGQPGCDVEAIAEVLAKLGEMGLDLKEYIAEIDLNPIIVLEPDCGLKVVDATVTIRNNITLDNNMEKKNGKDSKD